MLRQFRMPWPATLLKEAAESYEEGGERSEEEGILESLQGMQE
jgi:hypothetical protein